MDTRIISRRRTLIVAILIACVALAWVVARAVIQSVTIDEADTYLGFVAPDWPAQWYPSSGNHVLNSVLIRLFTWAFGLSPFTLRLPALIGAAIYLITAVRLCKLLTDSSSLMIPLLLCFCFNPFVMDHLVAARGYSLALAFLTAGLYIVLKTIGQDGSCSTVSASVYRDCVYASMFLALSFNANFSFAYVDAVSMMIFLVWTYWHRAQRDWARIAGACLIPGALITLVISGSVLVDWPKGHLVFGAASWNEVYRGLISSSFYELNQNLVNPLVYRMLDRTRRYLPGAAAVILCCQIALIMMRNGTRRAVEHKTVCLRAAGAITILILSLGLHELQFYAFGILLPKDRTALFLCH